MTTAQAGRGHAKKDRNNPAFKSQYATLSSLIDACRELLTANGISVIQSPSTDAEKKLLTLTTRLSHKSGEWIEGEISVPLSKTDVQSIGSAITYLRRYVLSSMAGIAPADDSDDDGNAAVADRRDDRRRDDRDTRSRDDRDDRDRRRDDDRREPARDEPARDRGAATTGDTPSVVLQTRMDKVFKLGPEDGPSSSEVVSAIYGDGFTDWWEIPTEKAEALLERISGCKTPSEAYDMIIKKYRSIVPF
jgi:hypothetical protein